MKVGVQASSAAAIVLIATTLSHAQSPPAGMQEFRIAWDLQHSPDRVAGDRDDRSTRVDRFQVLERKRGVAYAPRQRRPEVAAGQIVVVIVDQQGHEKGRTILPDPRVLRAEFPDESGQIQGTELMLPNAEFLVTLPDGPTLRELRIFEPRWNGREFELDLISTVAFE